jgi:hypothetical protein
MPNRVAAAASEGLSPREIALREGVSEGEIRLRLQLIEATGAAGESAGMTASEASADQPEQSYQTH